MRQRASDIGERIHTEDGIGTTIELFARFVRRGGMSESSGGQPASSGEIESTLETSVAPRSRPKEQAGCPLAAGDGSIRSLLRPHTAPAHRGLRLS